MGNTIDVGGIHFDQVKDTWQVLDFNYGMELGVIVLEAGPGWVFKPATTFLDVGHLKALYDFINNLPTSN